MRRLVLSIAVAATSLMPSVGMADDTQIAEYVKTQLQQQQELGNLKGFNVDMRVDQGTVWFEGFVSSHEQQMTILQSAQKAGHLGVVQVVNDIEVRAAKPSSPYQAAAYQQPQAPLAADVARTLPAVTAQYDVAQVQAAPVAYTQPQPQLQPYGEVQYPAESYGYDSQPLPFASCGDGCQPPVYGESYGSGASAPPAPVAYGGGPIAGGPVAGGVPSGPADLPGYAWPSYAASPNYGAVSYPRQHSASAWPYIGPFYPYPQVPLGWRKVTLEWDDGWWQLDFNDK